MEYLYHRYLVFAENIDFNIVFANYLDQFEIFPIWLIHSLLDKKRVAFTMLTVSMLEICFWVLIFYYMILIDKFNLFGLKKYAIKCNHPFPENKMIWDCFSDVCIGHFLIRPVLLFASYPLLMSRLEFDVEGIPNLLVFIIQIFVCMQVDDFMFYWGHRLLHHKLLYKYIHKVHHEFKYTIAMGVEWAHPIEEMFANTIPSIVSRVSEVIVGNMPGLSIIDSCMPNRFQNST